MDSKAADDDLFGMEIVRSEYIPDGVIVIANLDKCIEAILMGESIRDHMVIVDLRGVDE